MTSEASANPMIGMELDMVDEFTFSARSRSTRHARIVYESCCTVTAGTHPAVMMASGHRW